MLYVLTFKAQGLDHSIDWYFDSADEANRALELAQASPGMESVKLRDDFISDSEEFENWLVGESIEPVTR